MGQGAWLFLKRWVGLTRNGDERNTQEGRSAAGATVGVAETWSSVTVDAAGFCPTLETYSRGRE
jgi:hypothetical protein